MILCTATILLVTVQPKNADFYVIHYTEVCAPELLLFYDKRHVEVNIYQLSFYQLTLNLYHTLT